MDGDFKKTHESLELPKEDLEALFESTFAKMNPGAEIPAKSTSKTMDSEPPNPSRKRTPLRQRYEEEATRIQAEIGDIEAIRTKLGLSKRKICQLLMIDPSAWTRWTKGQSSVPPHIYRSLQWYMILQEKHPEYRSSLWLNSIAQPSLSAKELDSIQQKLIDSSKTEITKKAIHYLAEEDHKRNKLEIKLNGKIKRIEQGRKLLFILLGAQTALLFALLFIG